MIRLFTLKLPYPIEACTMKNLMDGGRAGVLVPTKVLQSDVPDPMVLIFTYNFFRHLVLHPHQ